MYELWVWLILVCEVCNLQGLYDSFFLILKSLWLIQAYMERWRPVLITWNFSQRQIELKKKNKIRKEFMILHFL